MELTKDNTNDKKELRGEGRGNFSRAKEGSQVVRLGATHSRKLITHYINKL